MLADWRRARQALRAAEVLTREKCYADAVSRCYYAAMYAARSALQVHDITATSHDAVRRLLGLHLVKSSEIEPEFAELFAESRDDRLAADYDAEAVFTDKMTRTELRRSRAFVGRIRRYLLKQGITEGELRKRKSG